MYAKSGQNISAYLCFFKTGIFA